ncbi:MAG: flagellar hook-length control protein FliK [Vicinamibacterales bacterium]
MLDFGVISAAVGDSTFSSDAAGAAEGPSAAAAVAEFRALVEALAGGPAAGEGRGAVDSSVVHSVSHTPAAGGEAVTDQVAASSSSSSGAAVVLSAAAAAAAGLGGLPDADVSGDPAAGAVGLPVGWTGGVIAGANGGTIEPVPNATSAADGVANTDATAADEAAAKKTRAGDPADPDEAADVDVIDAFATAQPAAVPTSSGRPGLRLVAGRDVAGAAGGDATGGSAPGGSADAAAASAHPGAAGLVPGAAADAAARAISRTGVPAGAGAPEVSVDGLDTSAAAHVGAPVVSGPSAADATPSRQPSSSAPHAATLAADTAAAPPALPDVLAARAATLTDGVTASAGRAADGWTSGGQTPGGHGSNGGQTPGDASSGYGAWARAQAQAASRGGGRLSFDASPSGGASVSGPTLGLGLVAHPPFGADLDLDADAEAEATSGGTRLQGPAPIAVPSVFRTAGATLLASGATAAAAPPTPPAEADAGSLPAGTAQQIVQAMRLQWSRGVGEAQIRLQPQQYGHLTVSLRVHHGEVVARLEAGAPAVREWLQANQATLRQSLADQHLTLDRLDVVEPQDPRDARQRDGRSSRDDQPDSSGRRRRNASDESGATFEVEM